MYCNSLSGPSGRSRSKSPGLGLTAQVCVGFWSQFRPEGPWELSPGFSLGLEFGHFFVAGRSAARFFSLSDGLEHQIQGGGLNRQGLLPGWG